MSAKKVGKTCKKGRAHYETGLRNNELGNWGLADEAFMKALLCFQDAKMWADVVNCHCSIGNVCHNKGNLRETIKHWTSAAEICEELLNDMARAGELFMDIGDVQYENREIYAAGDSYERASRLFESRPSGQQLNIARIQQRLGNVCFSLDRSEAAEQHFVRALTEYDALGREDEAAVITKAIGHIYMARKDYETAKLNFMDCFAVFSKMGREDVKRDLAGLLTEIDNYEKSAELKQRLKAIEAAAGDNAGACSPAFSRASAPMIDDGNNVYGLAAMTAGTNMLPASHYIGANSSDEENDDHFKTNSHRHLSRVDPTLMAGQQRAVFSPSSSKQKTKLHTQFEKLTRKQELTERTDKQHSPRVPLQTAERKATPKRKI